MQRIRSGREQQSDNTDVPKTGRPDERRRPIEVELEPIVLTADADPAGAIADRDELDRAFAHLDPDHRAVVVLRYFVGMPMADIASVMGIPIGTAKSRLNRALASMRVVVAPADTEPERSAKGHVA